MPLIPLPFEKVQEHCDLLAMNRCLVRIRELSFFWKELKEEVVCGFGVFFQLGQAE